MNKIPFPEHIFKDHPRADLFRRNWNSDPFKFVENLESELGIKTEYDEDTKQIFVMKRE